MASLEQFTDGGRTCWRLRAYVDRRRQSIGLGSLTADKAESAKRNIESQDNPFRGVKISLKSDKTKIRFITTDMTAMILEACPSQEWRVLFALARFGGLRCPSEVLLLRWSDIHWESGRILITSPKTAKYGKAERTIPLFPELRQELSDLSELIGVGIDVPLSQSVIRQYRSSEQNIRTELMRIAKRAGVPAWRKPFIALRSSRRTELERSGKHPNYVLNAWFGHSGQVAEEHYLQVTEDDFAEAIIPTANLVGRNVVPSGKPHKASNRGETSKTREKLAFAGASDGRIKSEKYTREDSNL